MTTHRALLAGLPGLVAVAATLLACSSADPEHLTGSGGDTAGAYGSSGGTGSSTGAAAPADGGGTSASSDAGASTDDASTPTTDAGGSGKTPVADSGTAKTVGYAAQAKAVLDGTCISCHVAGGQESKTPLDTFANAKSHLAANGGSSRVDDKSMPLNAPPLTASQLAILDGWVNGGYQP